MDTTLQEVKHMKRCLNCGLCVAHKQKFFVSSLAPKCQEILAHWTGLELPSDGSVCYACHKILAQHAGSTIIPERELGHKVICIGCGQSLHKTKRKPKKIEMYMDYISVYWPWHNMYTNKVCCHGCTLRIVRHMNKINGKSYEKNLKYDMSKVEVKDSDIRMDSSIITSAAETKNTPSISAGNIVLIDGIRARTSSGKCSYNLTCPNKDRRRIRDNAKTLLATTHNIYMPECNRVCLEHQSFEGYEKQILDNKYFTNFRVSQFEQFLEELKNGECIIDFENVAAMPENICRYWTGLTSLKFTQTFEDLNQPKLMKTALATYLIMKRKGDSLKKLAKLFNVPSNLLSKQVKTLEKYYSEDGSN